MLDVLMSGHRTATLHFGDCVGENELLKGSYMTASVTARGMVLLLRLEGQSVPSCRRTAAAGDSLCCESHVWCESCSM